MMVQEAPSAAACNTRRGIVTYLLLFKYYPTINSIIKILSFNIIFELLTLE